jgi:site-specific DNA-methyltransferase (adenine-specific)
MLNLPQNPKWDIARVSHSTLVNADCFDVFPLIADKSVDAIIADLPYGTTACKWDSVLPLDILWGEYNRIIKPKGAIILTASQPFTTTLIESNKNNFAFAWVWDKKFGANFVQAKRQPIKTHEDVLIFTNGGMQPNYYPQMIKRDKPIKKGGNKQSDAIPIARTENAKLFGEKGKEYNEKHPTSIIQFDVRKGRGYHPTQKPIELMEYLIKTYTKEDEIILDNTMGSGTTGLACLKTNRQFIGIEKEKQYYDVAVRRALEYCH